MAEIDLSKKFPELTPIESAPTLFNVNGCGLTMYGKRDWDQETGSYVGTTCFCLVFVPIFFLKSYRVVPAERGGWYFLGRQPLSGLAKIWNLLIVAVIAAGIAAWQFHVYTSSPKYKAAQQMAAAQKLVDQDNLGEAARIYSALVMNNTPEGANATTALQDLLQNRTDKVRMDECPKVFEQAVLVARRGGALVPAEVSARGMKLVAARGQATPRAGVGVLDAIRPLALDTRDIDAQRLKLLRLWAAADPKNLEAITPLAALLEQSNQLDDAEKLLLPVKDQLGDTESARVLGIILSRKGDLDGAYALLWPYVKNRLDRLHSAEAQVSQAAESAWKREVEILEKNQGPRSFYDQYEKASKDEQGVIVREYVGGRLKDDPGIATAQATLEQATAVVPVALELGIVMLNRAHGQADAEARKSQLQSAETVFTAVGGVAGESDTYRLALGEVQYWLGKQADGKKLFEEFLTSKSRSPESLVQVASTFRSLGDNNTARALSEEAYAKATKPEERHAAAALRARTERDLDDEIDWLQKAGGAPEERASLAQAMGRRAFQRGQDAEAAAQYRSAIDAYAAMQRGTFTLNQTALAYYELYVITGEHELLEKCIDCFQQAVDSNPKDSIVLFNASITILEGVVRDVIGNAIDLRALRQSGGINLLRYLYRNDAEKNEVAQRFSAHPGTAKVLSFIEKVLVLAPQNENAYSHAYSIHNFTRNEKALLDLERRVLAAQLDRSQQLAQIKESLSGTKDSQRLEELNAAVKRLSDLLPALREKGGLTYAVALDRYADYLMQYDLIGQPVDADRAHAMAEEAAGIAPSSSTVSSLISAKLHRAAKQLRASDREFDAFWTRHRRVMDAMTLFAAAVQTESPFREKVWNHPEVRAAMELNDQQNQGFPTRRSGSEWAFMQPNSPAAAMKIAKIIQDNKRAQCEQRIIAILSPYSVDAMIELAWQNRACNEPVDESKLDALRAAGIPVPFTK